MEIDKGEFDSIIEEKIDGRKTIESEYLSIEDINNLKNTTYEKVSVGGYLKRITKLKTVKGTKDYNKNETYYQRSIILCYENFNSSLKIMIWNPQVFEIDALKLKYLDHLIIKNLWLKKDSSVYNWGNVALVGNVGFKQNESKIF